MDEQIERLREAHVALNQRLQEMISLNLLGCRKTAVTTLAAMNELLNDYVRCCYVSILRPEGFTLPVQPCPLAFASLRCRCAAAPCFRPAHTSSS